MKKFYSLTNLIVVIALIAWNYLSNTGIINDKTISSISSEYTNLFTPAGYAFSIWGLIFLGLLALAIFMVKRVFTDKKDDEFVLKIGPWLIIANIANGAWVYAWLTELTGLSVFIMLTILIALIIIILKLNMEKIQTTRSEKIWVWYPVGIYAGWITVASVANVTAYLAKIEWSFLFSETTWAILMIVTATFINVVVLITRKMTDFTLMGVWALTAIAFRHWDKISEIQWTAAICALFLLLYIINKQIRRFRLKTKS